MVVGSIRSLFQDSWVNQLCEIKGMMGRIYIAADRSQVILRVFAFLVMALFKKGVVQFPPLMHFMIFLLWTPPQRLTGAM